MPRNNGHRTRRIVLKISPKSRVSFTKAYLVDTTTADQPMWIFHGLDKEL